MEPLVNRVAESEIEVFNLESLIDWDSLVEFDISSFLDKGIILREKEFRMQARKYDWSEFEGKVVALTCSTNAIIPTWAYMLLAVHLDGIAGSVYHGSKDDIVKSLYRKVLENYDWSRYHDAIVVIKGCGSKLVPEDAYLGAMQHLMAHAKKIMYGEPCSSVPLWRRKSSDANASTGARAVKADLPGAPGT